MQNVCDKIHYNKIHYNTLHNKKRNPIDYLTGHNNKIKNLFLGNVNYLREC